MSELIHKIFDLVGVPLLVLVFIILFLFESKYQLRKRVGNRFNRIVTNTVVSIPAFALLRFLLLPALVWIAYRNQALQFGINYLYDLPVFLEYSIAFLLLDYGNYGWHFLNHRLPFLWRFHLVHHTDVDLDITTAFRFHFGELIGSVVSRGAIVLLTGATPILVLIYEIVFEAATQFHHSNLRLPPSIDRGFNKILVTPRMHGIHHSVVKSETDSNYSVIFSWWDRLHQTLNVKVNQNLVVTGVPSYPDARELTIGYLLRMPFRRTREWQAPPSSEETKTPSSVIEDK